MALNLTKVRALRNSIQDVKCYLLYLQQSVEQGSADTENSLRYIRAELGKAEKLVDELED